jgi:hypothetical protein
MSQVTRQAMTDDSGVFTDGTTVNKAFVDQIYDQIDDQAHSTTNPTIKPKVITDEVVAARGSKASLDARLDVALNEDGTPKTGAGVTLDTVAATLPQSNVVLNETFIIWADGDSAAPTGWTLAGTGAAAARAGTGLGDTTRKVGDFCAKLTYGSATLTLSQDVLPTAAFSRVDYLRGTTVGFGAWVKSAVANQARIYVTDGVTTTYSSYHTGAAAFEWLSLTHVISGSGTKLTVGISVESSAGNPAYFSGPTLLLASLAPTNWRPTPNIVSTVGWTLQGSQTVGTTKGAYIFNRMAFVKYIQCSLQTAPTGSTTFKVDVNRTATTMLASAVTFTAGDKATAKAPDGTYSQRCFPGTNLASGTTLTDQLSFDIDAVGSTIAGSDLNVLVRFLEFVDPFESVKAA